MSETRTGYMCGIAFQHEITPDRPRPVEVWGTIEALKHAHHMWAKCGIVEVVITEARWVEAQTL